VVLTVEEGIVVHGLAGYFESVLYGDVEIYQPALTHTGNVQLLPNLLPLPDPIIVQAAANVQVDFWRLTADGKVWYEWSVMMTLADDTFLSVTPLYNGDRRSSWIGL
jgi:type II protein arginine methyltransferase